jgi:hypothetical protein
MMIFDFEFEDTGDDNNALYALTERGRNWIQQNLGISPDSNGVTLRLPYKDTLADIRKAGLRIKTL